MCRYRFIAFAADIFFFLAEINNIGDAMSSPKCISKTPETSDKIDKHENEADENSNSSNPKDLSNENFQDSFNPNIPEGEENEILERLRGDAIGTTLYSERFVITTLMKLREMKDTLEEDEKLEGELESLWDMTIEKDVTLKLIELDVYAIFTQSIIKYEKDSRLIEIIVGIIANMCSVSKEALEKLCKSETTVEVLLGLIACGDSCVLIQLMRLITLAYGNTESAQIFNNEINTFPEFFENYCFILNSSNNQSLLELTLESLNAILAKCATMAYSNDDATAIDATTESYATILEVFVNTKLIASTIEAFQTFYTKEMPDNSSNETDDDAFNDTHLISEALKKTFIVFLNVHEIFVNYKPEVYNENNEIDLCCCLNIVLKTVASPNFVLPANNDYLQEILETLLPFYTPNKNLHNEETVLAVINLWQILKSHADIPQQTTNGKKNDFEYDDRTTVNDDDNDNDDELKQLCELGEELLNVLLKQYNKALANILGRCKTDLALQIFKFYGLNVNDYHEEDFNAYCTQLSSMLLNA